MPLLKEIASRHGKISIWEMNEAVEVLRKTCRLNPKDQQLFSSFKAEKRQKEFLCTRLLLQKTLSTPPEIVYEHPSGKPILRDQKSNISITHSANLAAVYLSDKLVGIDIEKLDRNIDKVLPRFVNPYEMNLIKNTSQPQLLKILLWCAKEAIFKCSCIHEILFNEHIIIDPFDCISTKSFSGSLVHPTGTYKYSLNYHIIKDNVLVYCVQQ